VKKSESISNLAKALIIATRQIDSKVLKNALNESIGNSYADLGAIIEAVKKPLADNGIVTIQSPTASSKADEISLITLLLHETGEWIEDTVTCPLVFQDPQGFGSAVSYVRRYCLGSMLMLYSCDDDAQTASARSDAVVEGSSATSASVASKPGQNALEATNEALTPDVRKRLDQWLNTIKNASLQRLETSRSSAKTTFSGKAFEIVDAAFEERINALRSASQPA
jgi:hypothetical protein